MILGSVQYWVDTIIGCLVIAGLVIALIVLIAVVTDDNDS